MAKLKGPGKTRKGGKVRPQRGARRRRAQEQRAAVDVSQTGGDGARQEHDAPADIVARSNAEFSIGGVGASAGGLGAFTQFLHALPDNTGGAHILVQPLSPQPASGLP